MTTDQPISGRNVLGAPGRHTLQWRVVEDHPDVPGNHLVLTIRNELGKALLSLFEPRSSGDRRRLMRKLESPTLKLWQGLLAPQQEYEHWNSPELLPPVDCPLVVRYADGGNVALRVKSLGHLANRDGEMEYQALTSQIVITGRLPWSYR